jgi:hypothetical protein
MARRRKVDSTGRVERPEHWTKMLRPTMEEPAWRALSPTAQALYPWLKLEWKGPQANNNGQIRLSVKQAAERMGVATNTAMRAFHDLQAKGFLVVTEHARLGVAGQAKAPAYELTEIELPQASQHGGRRLYRSWRKGHDFPVQRAIANNPTGRRSRAKAEPCLTDEDDPISNVATFRRKPSQK